MRYPISSINMARQSYLSLVLPLLDRRLYLGLAGLGLVSLPSGRGEVFISEDWLLVVWWLSLNKRLCFLGTTLISIFGWTFERDCQSILTTLSSTGAIMSISNMYLDALFTVVRRGLFSRKIPQDPGPCGICWGHHPDKEKVYFKKF